MFQLDIFNQFICEQVVHFSLILYFLLNLFFMKFIFFHFFFMFDVFIINPFLFHRYKNNVPINIHTHPGKYEIQSRYGMHSLEINK